MDAILRTATSKQFEGKHGRFDRILCLGDVLERGTDPRSVLATLRRLSEMYPVESVMGNHDEAFLYGRFLSGSSMESAAAHDALGERDLEFFARNEDGSFGRQEFVDRSKGILCVHGGPLDPERITPKMPECLWLYQKTWQRLSPEWRDHITQYGYNYSPDLAFEAAQELLRRPLIFCGHQHTEAAIERLDSRVRNIMPRLQRTEERMADAVLRCRVIHIRPDAGYIIRVGLAGPQGSYGAREIPHFALADHDSRTVRLFSIGS